MKSICSPLVITLLALANGCFANRDAAANAAWLASSAVATNAD